MTREFKVGDRVVSDIAEGFGVGRVVSHGKVRFERYGYRTDDDFHAISDGLCLRHAEPVPIGYTGKLRDMDLQEGDVVRVVGGKSWAVTGVDADGMVMINDPPATRLSSALDYTLISRANRAQATPPDQWSDWLLSRKDGTITVQYAEVQTVPLDGTDQVVYRGLGEPVRREVMTVSVAIVDGQPDWDTVEEVVL